MTWMNRLRLYGSIIAVLLVAALLTLLFNQRQHQIQSRSAMIDAPTYTVGSEYGGTVIDQPVAVGDPVTKGQKLFTVSSITYQQDVGNGVTVASSDAVEVDAKKGTVTYKATDDGVVTQIAAEKGAYVANGQPLATVTRVGGRVVVADMELSPRDYGRIEKGAEVEILLPNNKTVMGQVDSATVRTEQSKAMTRLRITSEELNAADLKLLATDGAPVTARVMLRDDGVLAGPTDVVLDFLRKVGLR